MTRLFKNQMVDKPLTTTNQAASAVAPNINAGLGFNVQSNRITSREETYLKIKGAFKIEVENNGTVDIIIFGNFNLPAYSKKTFETGDSLLVFKTDTLIEYAPLALFENINILLTTYTK